MKSEEDEAFDELAKRQGAWGGGFKAKQAMAADKLQKPVCDKDPQGCWNVRCQLGKQCKNLAQPAQEPLAWMVYTQDGKSVYVTDNPTDIQEGQRALPLYTTPPQRQWIWLSDADIAEVVDTTCQYSGGYEEYLIKKAERKIKEKNG